MGHITPKVDWVFTSCTLFNEVKKKKREDEQVNDVEENIKGNVGWR